MNRKNTRSGAESKPQYAFATNCTLAFCMMSSLAACHIPGSQDAENANAVGQFIAKKYDRFEDRIHVEKNHRGKIYYTRAGRYPTIQFYEVSDLKEIAAIEEYARESLKLIKVDRVNLIFYEKQNMHCAQDNVCSRQKERIIKKVEVGR